MKLLFLFILFASLSAQAGVESSLLKYESTMQACYKRGSTLDDSLACVKTANSELEVYGKSLFSAYRATLELGSNSSAAISHHDKAHGIWTKYRTEFCQLSGEIRGKTEKMIEFRRLECMRGMMESRIRQLYP